MPLINPLKSSSPKLASKIIWSFNIPPNNPQSLRISANKYQKAPAALSNFNLEANLNVYRIYKTEENAALSWLVLLEELKQYICLKEVNMVWSANMCVLRRLLAASYAF